MDLHELLKKSIEKIGSKEIPQKAPEKIKIAREYRPYEDHSPTVFQKNKSKIDSNLDITVEKKSPNKDHQGVQHNKETIELPVVDVTIQPNDQKTELSLERDQIEIPYLKNLQKIPKTPKVSSASKVIFSERPSKATLKEKEQIIQQATNLSVDKSHLVSGPNNVIKSKTEDLTKQTLTRSVKKSGISIITGNERTILDYIFRLSRYGSSRLVGPLSKDDLLTATQIKEKSLKKTLERLKLKNIMIIHSKMGNGGWRQFEINEEIYHELLKNEKVLESTQKRSPEHEQAVEQTNRPSSEISSLSEFLNPSSIDSNLPTDWERIDFSDIKAHGFSRNHIIQFYKDYKKNPSVKLDAQAIQDSIFAFAYDMKHHAQRVPTNTQGSKIGFFINMMSKGRPYNPVNPEEFKSPTDFAIAEYKRRMETQEKHISYLKEKYFNTEYDKWFDALTENEIKDIVGVDFESSMSGVGQLMLEKLKIKKIRSFFEEVVWPVQRKKLTSQ